MSNTVIKQRLAFLDKYLKRDDVVEICVNKPGEVYLEITNGEWDVKKDNAMTIENLRRMGEVLANDSGDQFDTFNPIFAGRIPGYKYRIQLNMFGHVESGVAMSIRVAKAKRMPINSYMSDDEADHLVNLVKSGKTMLVIAGTGCGKTTLLNSLLAHIPSDNRIITIEDTRELEVPHKNAVSFVVSKSGSDAAQIGYSHMIDSCLRQRPDRILLGEITVANVMPFLNISSSGHRGSISTLHAHTPTEAINKLCTNAMISGVRATKEDMAGFAKDCIDAFVMLEKRIVNGERHFRAWVEEIER